jgi:exopolysaccharide production protein ExoQ
VKSLERPKASEWLFGASATFFSATALLQFVAFGVPNDYTTPNIVHEGADWVRLLWSFLYAAAGVGCVAELRSRGLGAGGDAAVGALVTLCVLSVIWSTDRQVTVMKLGALIGTTVIGLYVGLRFSQEQVVWLLGWVIVASEILSVVTVLYYPRYGLQPYGRSEAWRGLFVHKNALGRAMVLGAVVWLLIGKNLKDRKRILAYLNVGMCAVLVGLSGSKTALVVMISLGLFLLTTLVPYGSLFAIILIVPLVGTAATYALSTPHPIMLLLKILGRDETLSGRTILWYLLLKAIRRRPWFGYGFGAFWLGWNGPSGSVQLKGVVPTFANNGFLDLAADLGIVGVGGFLGALGVRMAQATRLFRGAQSVFDYFPVIFLLFVFLYNFTEETNLAGNSVYWLLFVTTSVQLAGASKNRDGPGNSFRRST